jgi:ligand-binding sensor domain-containing protein
MKKLSKFLMLLLSVSFSMNAFTQDSDKKNGDGFFKDYVSQRWTAEDGIPGNTITDIIQTDEGYIYFGTYGGLVRFDGVEFKIINQKINSKYRFQSARSLMQDSRGNVWIGSNEDGAFCIFPDGDVKEFSIENGLPNNSIRSFCEDKDGNVWIGTASGIARVSSKYEVIRPEGFDNIPNNNNFIVSQLYCDTAGRVWIVTRTEKGLYLYSDRKFSVYNDFHSKKNPIITVMTQDSNGVFWFGVAPYYAIKKSNTEETIYNLGKGNQRGTVVTSIFQDKKLNLWFGLDNGVTILHDGKISFFDRSMGLVDENVVKIIEDRESNIWIATDRGGLEKLSYGKFQTTRVGTTVNGIAQDTFRHVVWIAGDNGLYCYKDNLFQENYITDYCKNVRIRDVSLDKKGNLLVSCYEKLGFVKFYIDGRIKNWTTEEGLAGNKVRVAKELSNGDIYVGTTTGLSIIKDEGKVIRNIQKNDVIDNDYIMCVYENKNGEIWIGTDGGGIFILKDEKIIKTISKKDGLVGNVIFKIDSIRDGEIWICTGSGATRIKDDKYFSYNNLNGFVGEGVFQLIPDYMQRVWGTSNRGIFYVHMEDLDEVMEGKKKFLNLKFFNRFDGITGGQPTPTSLSMKDDLGRVWFTLIEGFTIFDPIRNETNSYAPEIKIQEVYADSERIDIKNGTVVLSPKVKRLNIKYTGISFVSPEQVEFKTVLEGFDKDFSEWSNMRNATYTNLQPGEYTFKIRAQNGDGVLSEETEVLKIIKQPYLWQRLWFKIVVALSVIAFISIIVLLKLNTYKKNQEMMEKLSIEVIQALVGTIDAKDKYTNGHSNRVANYSKQLAISMGLPESIQKRVYYSALLHDIGKIGISDSIINKPGKLTKKEYETIKQHPTIGSQILQSITTMPEITVGARGHHERYDGSGYPDKIKGKDIPLIARIIGVADAYDAMTSNRSYRKFMEQAKVRSELNKYKGTQFDPEIADKMIEIIDEDKDYKLHE